MVPTSGYIIYYDDLCVIADFIYLYNRYIIINYYVQYCDIAHTTVHCTVFTSPRAGSSKTRRALGKIKFRHSKNKKNHTLILEWSYTISYRFPPKTFLNYLKNVKKEKKGSTVRPTSLNINTKNGASTNVPL